MCSELGKQMCVSGDKSLNHNLMFRKWTHIFIRRCDVLVTHSTTDFDIVPGSLRFLLNWTLYVLWHLPLAARCVGLRPWMPKPKSSPFRASGLFLLEHCRAGVALDPNPPHSTLYILICHFRPISRALKLGAATIFQDIFSTPSENVCFCSVSRFPSPTLML
jgi:hypothetical protein